MRREPNSTTQRGANFEEKETQQNEIINFSPIKLAEGYECDSFAIHEKISFSFCYSKLPTKSSNHFTLCSNEAIEIILIA